MKKITMIIAIIVAIGIGVFTGIYHQKQVDNKKYEGYVFVNTTDKYLYNGEPVIVSGDTVRIGSLILDRSKVNLDAAINPNYTGE